jgi:hypothetical protein
MSRCGKWVAMKKCARSGDHVRVLFFTQDRTDRSDLPLVLWNGHAFMFVVDAAAPERFLEAKEELHRLHEEIRLREYAHPLLVVASKMDVGGAADLGEISRALETAGLANGNILGLKVGTPNSLHSESNSNCKFRACP